MIRCVWFTVVLVLLGLGGLGFSPMAHAADAKPVKVVFICQHGYAKSLVAARHFERIAAERGLKVEIISRGLTPQDHVPDALQQQLRTDGFDVKGFQPQPLTANDVSNADYVVTIGVDANQPTRGTAIRWDDVPALSENYDKARDSIVQHLNGLADQLAAKADKPPAGSAQPGR